MIQICLLLQIVLGDIAFNPDYLGPITNLTLLAGQFKRLKLPFTFDNYRSIELTKNESNHAVCTIEEMDLDI